MLTPRKDRFLRGAHARQHHGEQWWIVAPPRSEGDPSWLTGVARRDGPLVRVIAVRSHPDRWARISVLHGSVNCGRIIPKPSELRDLATNEIPLPIPGCSGLMVAEVTEILGSAQPLLFDRWNGLYIGRAANVAFCGWFEEGAPHLTIAQPVCAGASFLRLAVLRDPTGIPRKSKPADDWLCSWIPNCIERFLTHPAGLEVIQAAEIKVVDD